MSSCLHLAAAAYSGSSLYMIYPLASKNVYGVLRFGVTNIQMSCVTLLICIPLLCYFNQISEFSIIFLN